MDKLPQVEAGKPFVLPNGVEIRPAEDDASAATVVTKEEQITEEEIDDILADPFSDDAEQFQRTLADVHVSAKQFNPVMLVLAYTLWGLDTSAISRLLATDEVAIEAVMQSELFTDTRKEMLEAIRYAENSTIHGYLSQQAKKAAVTMGSMLKSKSPDIKLAAAKDILDRANFRPIDRVEHTHKFDDELRIVHVTEGSTPAIEVEI